MRTNLAVAASIFLFSHSSFANVTMFGGGVQVPSVTDKSNWDNGQPGDIILDTSDNNFYGLD